MSFTARAVGIDLDHAVTLEVDEHVGRDRLDLGHDQPRPLLLDQAPQRGAIGHRDHVRAMRDLMARRVGVAVHGDDLHAQPLQRDDDFLAELPAAQQHHFRGRGRDGRA